MARSFRGFSRGSRSARRKTSWQLGPGGVAVQSISSTSSTILGSGSIAVEDGMTLARLRGEFLMHLATADAANTSLVGALGIGITKAAAFAIGATAMETPIDDETWDGWIYHRYFALNAVESITAATSAAEGLQANSTVAAVRIEVDSKAMRKLITEDVIFAMVQVTEAGTAVGSVFFNSRLLVMLP